MLRASLHWEAPLCYVEQLITGPLERRSGPVIGPVVIGIIGVLAPGLAPLVGRIAPALERLRSPRYARLTPDVTSPCFPLSLDVPNPVPFPLIIQFPT